MFKTLKLDCEPNIMPFKLLVVFFIGIWLWATYLLKDEQVKSGQTLDGKKSNLPAIHVAFFIKGDLCYNLKEYIWL